MVQGRLRSVCALSTVTVNVMLYIIDETDCVIISGYIIRCVVCCYDTHLGYYLSMGCSLLRNIGCGCQSRYSSYNQTRCLLVGDVLVLLFHNLLPCTAYEKIPIL